MKTIAITGASGFIGKELESFFSKSGFTVIQINKTDFNNDTLLKQKIEDSDIVFNLAGATILKRWSKKYKEELYSSRIDTTNKLIETINHSNKQVELLISASALGIYDNKKHYNEDNAEFSNDFLSLLCQDWEKASLKAKCRVVNYRLGIVLGKDGGVFKKMKNVFSMGFGAKISAGTQALSFIHIKDLKSAFYFAIENASMHHAYNLCASIPTTNNTLTKVLAKELKKPVLFTLPKKLLEVVYGEGANVLTQGQSVYPKRLEEAGFNFEFSCIEDALHDLCLKK